jgi:hypothetical protein
MKRKAPIQMPESSTATAAEKANLGAESAVGGAKRKAEDNDDVSSA